MGLFVGLLVFLSISLVAFAILSTLFSEERRVTKLMGQMSRTQAEQTMAAEPLLKPFQDRVLAPMADTLMTMGRAAGPGDLRDRIRKRLLLAGSPKGLDADRFFALKLLSVLIALGVLVLLILLFRPRVGTIIFMLIVLLPTGFFVPDVWLHNLISRRKKEIRRKLPDALDMLTISVEAGLGFDAAIARLIKNISGPLAVEFGRMLFEMNAGTPRGEALKHLAERTEVPELNSFVTAMVQADMFGVGIAKILRTQSSEMRIRRRQLAEEKAQKAPVKLVFPLVLCIFPATLIVIGGPAVISVGRALGLIQ